MNISYEISPSIKNMIKHITPNPNRTFIMSTNESLFIISDIIPVISDNPNKHSAIIRNIVHCIGIMLLVLVSKLNVKSI